jgi:pseudoazurin
VSSNLKTIEYRTTNQKEYLNMKSVLKLAIGLAAASVMIGSASAAEHVINMLNKGADGKAMVFEPDFVRAAVGDTIKIVPVDKGHFAVPLPKVWPKDVAEVKGKMNTELVFTVDKEGIYGIKCTPHYAMGMVGIIQVGAAPVSDELKALKLPGEVGKRFAAQLEKAAAP